MARTTAKAGSTRQPFRFDEDSRKALRARLGSSAGAIVPELEIIIRHARVTLKGPIPECLRPFSTKWLDDLRPTVRALASLVKAVDALSDDVKKALSVPSGPPMDVYMERFTQARISNLDRLLVLRVEAAKLLKSIDVPKRPGQRGRRTDVMRHMLALEVALLLDHCGIRLTTSREGKFATVLHIVFDEVLGTAAPVETFAYIKSAADSVRAMTPTVLELLAQNVFANPRFWSRSHLVH